MEPKRSEDGRASLVFSVRGPIPIQMDEGMSRGGYGASVLDLIFPQPETVNEIRFRNWYTARLSLLVRFDDSVQAPPKKEHLAWAAAASLSLARLRGVESTEGIKIGRNLNSASRSNSDWSISLQNKVLMPDAHCETGSQDIIMVSATESLVALHDVTALRFILRQPSPNWKTFNIEDIAVFRDPLVKMKVTNTPRSDSGLGSSSNGSKNTTASSTPRSTSAASNSAAKESKEPKANDDVLDRLAKQTAAALKGGRSSLNDDMDSSSSDAGVREPFGLALTYDVISLNF